MSRKKEVGDSLTGSPASINTISSKQSNSQILSFIFLLHSWPVFSTHLLDGGTECPITTSKINISKNELIGISCGLSMASPSPTSHPQLQTHYTKPSECSLSHASHHFLPPPSTAIVMAFIHAGILSIYWLFLPSLVSSTVSSPKWRLQTGQAQIELCVKPPDTSFQVDNTKGQVDRDWLSNFTSALPELCSLHTVFKLFEYSSLFSHGGG